MMRLSRAADVSALGVLASRDVAGAQRTRRHERARSAPSAHATRVAWAAMTARCSPARRARHRARDSRPASPFAPTLCAQAACASSRSSSAWTQQLCGPLLVVCVRSCDRSLSRGVGCTGGASALPLVRGVTRSIALVCFWWYSSESVCEREPSRRVPHGSALSAPQGSRCKAKGGVYLILTCSLHWWGA